MLNSINSFVGVRIGSPAHVNWHSCAESTWAVAAAVDLVPAYYPV